MLKYATYLILPVCLLQAANFSGLMGGMTDLYRYAGGRVEMGDDPLSVSDLRSHSIMQDLSFFIFWGLAVDLFNLCHDPVIH